MTCEGCGASMTTADCAELKAAMTGRSTDNRRLVVRRLFTDSYALQHPDSECPEPTDRAAHLLGLCCVMEYNGSLDVYSGMKSWLVRAGDLPLLAAPDMRGAMTILDIKAATGLEEHIEAVRKWGRCVWEAWYEHHDTVRGWIEEIRGR